MYIERRMEMKASGLAKRLQIQLSVQASRVEQRNYVVRRELRMLGYQYIREKPHQNKQVALCMRTGTVPARMKMIPFEDPRKLYRGQHVKYCQKTRQWQRSLSLSTDLG